MRGLTNIERSRLVCALELMRTGDQDAFEGKIEPVDPTPYLDQVPSLTVERECGCGQENCESIWFNYNYAGKNFKGCGPISISNTEDGRLLIVHAVDKTKELVEMEVI